MPRKVGRAAIYVRVSTDAQTVENQIRELRRIAGRRGWKVVEVYTDAGISGAKLPASSDITPRTASIAARESHYDQTIAFFS
jgi:hypothetical protein